MSTQPKQDLSILPRIDPEFKALVPPLSAEEYEQLEQNILEARKCYDPIVVWDGDVVEGYNRYGICIKHGIAFEVKEIKLESREEAKLWILNNQLGRRNLNEAQRINTVLLKEEILRKIAKKNLSLGGGDKKSRSPLPKTRKPDIESINVQEVMATEAQVSKGTLHNYTKVKEEASPELLASIQSGEVKIGTAHRMLTSEILKQLSQADKMYRFMQSAIPAEGLEAIDPQLYQQLAKLAENLRRLIATIGKRRKELS